MLRNSLNVLSFALKLNQIAANRSRKTNKLDNKKQRANIMIHYHTLNVLLCYLIFLFVCLLKLNLLAQTL